MRIVVNVALYETLLLHPFAFSIASFGKIRFMSRSGCDRKFNVSKYISEQMALREAGVGINPHAEYPGSGSEPVDAAAAADM